MTAYKLMDFVWFESIKLLTLVRGNWDVVWGSEKLSERAYNWALYRPGYQSLVCVHLLYSFD